MAVDLETCGWCTTEWPYSRLKVLPGEWPKGSDEAAICPDCVADLREARR